jgi:predicted Zn-dependent protease
MIEADIETILRTMQDFECCDDHIEWKYEKQFYNSQILTAGPNTFSKNTLLKCGLSIRALNSGKAGFTYTNQIAPQPIKNAIHFASQLKYFCQKEENTIYNTHVPRICNNLKNYEEPSTTSDTSINNKLWPAIKKLGSKIQIEKIELEKHVGFGNNRGGWARYLRSHNLISLIYYGIQTYFHCLDNRSVFTEETIDALSELIHCIEAGKYGSKNKRNRVQLCLFSPQAFEQILHTLSKQFSAGYAAKKLSVFNEEQNRSGYDEKFCLYDDPCRFSSLTSYPFDAEGTPSEKLILIENGQFKSLVNNLYYAKKYHEKPTGHAYQSSYKDPVGIHISNWGVKEGTMTTESLFNLDSECIYVYQIQETSNDDQNNSNHAAFKVHGIFIKNGKKKYLTSCFILDKPVHLLKNIIAVGTEKKPGSLYDLPMIMIKNVKVLWV